MDEKEIDRMIKYRVCAWCFSHLVKYMFEYTLEIKCPNCNSERELNTISKKALARRLEQDKVDRLEIVSNPVLKEALGIAKKTPKQILEELGY